MKVLTQPFTRSNAMKFTEQEIRQSRCYGKPEGFLWVHPANKAIWPDGDIIEASVPERERDSDRLTPDEAVRLLRERGVIEDEPAFMIGDKVEVVGPIDKEWGGYVPSLEFCIGLFGKIKHVAGCTNLVDFGSVKWGFPASSLRHAKAEAAPAQPDKWAHLPTDGSWTKWNDGEVWHYKQGGIGGDIHYENGSLFSTHSFTAKHKHPELETLITRDEAIALFEAHAAAPVQPDKWAHLPTDGEWTKWYDHQVWHYGPGKRSGAVYEKNGVQSGTHPYGEKYNDHETEAFITRAEAIAIFEAHAAAPVQPDKWAHLPTDGEWMRWDDGVWHYRRDGSGGCKYSNAGSPVSPHRCDRKHVATPAERLITRAEAIAIFEANAAPEHIPNDGKMVGDELATAEARIAVHKQQFIDATAMAVYARECLNQSSADHAICKDELLDACRVIDELRAKAAEMAKTIKYLDDRVVVLEIALADARSSESLMRSYCETEDRARAGVVRQVLSMDETIAGFRKETEKLTLQLTDATASEGVTGARLATAEAAVADLMEQVDERDATISEQRLEIAWQNRDNVLSKKRIDEHHLEIVRQRKQMDEHELAIDGLRKQLSKDEAGYDDLMRHFEEHERTIADLRKQATDGAEPALTVDQFFARTAAMCLAAEYAPGTIGARADDIVGEAYVLLAAIKAREAKQ